MVSHTPGGFEPKFRSLVMGLLGSVETWGTVFAPLRDTAGGQDGRREQRKRNRRTIDYFTDLAVQDFGLDVETARRAMKVVLGGIDPLMWMVRPSTSAEERDRLVQLFVRMQMAALQAVAN